MLPSHPHPQLEGEGPRPDVPQDRGRGGWDVDLSLVDGHSYRVQWQDGREESFGTDYQSAVRFSWTVGGVLKEYCPEGHLTQWWDDTSDLWCP